MDKRKLAAHITIIAMLCAAAVALKYGVDVTLEDKPGVYMRMPPEVGAWQGQQLHYCHKEECRWSGLTGDMTNGLCPTCSASTFTMAWVEKDQLPADTEFLKYFYRQPAGESLLVSIVLSGNERSSIHRPQRCLVAQGFDITRTRQEPIEMPNRAPLDVMLLDTLLHSRPGEPEHKVFYAYWFVGQDRETPRHLARMFWLAWDRIFRGVAHRWVYIMIQGRGHRSREAFTEALEDFIPTWYEDVRR